MRIQNGKIRLSSQKERELNLPIDLFFRSLATEAGSSAIAIILSGTGSDGTNGIKAIKESEGMILVQDLDTAKFDGMPRSAMRTGLVDAQMTPERIAEELVHISGAAQRQQNLLLKTEKQIDEELMKKIYFILKKVSNVNFAHYKQTTILRRIERRMMLTHKEQLSEYVEYLYESPEEVKTLSKEVLIGVTSFFRDPDFFQLLKDTAVQDILLRSAQGTPIRIWVAGCSTGEEAYSIAILFCEVMEAMQIKRDVKIFATDLDVASISIAGKGAYSDSIVETVGISRLSRYFTRQDNSYVVNREIRKMIVFSPHNVFQDPPFGHLDLISCRNMLIYFQPVLQNDLFAIFHASLRDGGFLFLGKSEAIGAFTEAYPVVDAAAKIFSHRSDVKIAGVKTVPYLQTTYLDEDVSNEADIRFPHRQTQADLMKSSEDRAIDNTLLEQFMPACLVINEKNELVHSYGESSNYVHFSVGKFSNIIYDVLTEALKVPVSTLLKEARVRMTKVQYKNIFFTGEREEACIHLTAMPVSRNPEEKGALFALIFSEVHERGDFSAAVPYEMDRVASQRITDLEQDLGEVQGKLDRSIAEQECVNEELQAANEELLTANEELQSSNEELQSVNEELYTVNSEYQLKLTELADLNDDIANFLASTLIGIIFVDNKLNIRRYTDYVTTEFSVMDHDIGRSLKFISYHFPTVDISEICVNVLKTLVPDEREIMTGKHKVFFMRVAPYRSTENKILGCVITLVDVTTQKQGQMKLQNTEERLSMVQQANEEKRDYLSRIANEIQTPMEKLVALSRVALQHQEDPEQLRRMLYNVSECIEYMASVVTDISEAAKCIGSGTETLEKPFALRSVLDNVEHIISGRAAEEKNTFEIIMENDFAPMYLGNQLGLQQILVHFLSRTLQCAQPEDVISLHVSEKTAKSGKVSLRFVISNAGKGIGEKLLEEITKLSHHEHQGESKNGVGLPIAYNLIESMNGSVNVEHFGEQDAVIAIDLTFEPSRNGANHGGLEKDESLHLRGCHVLIAEDNEINRMILAAILEHEGMTYTEAADGAIAVEAYEKAPEGTFDVILMDMRMPRMDGIRATAAIRASEHSDAASIPIIGVSANGFFNDMKQAEKAGLNSYTTKPIDKDRLLEIMNQLIVSRQY